MKKPGKSSDSGDAELWRQITENVDPLPGKSRKKLNPPPVTRPMAVAKKPLADISPSPSVFDRQTVRKIKRGRMAIESSIDLHGMTQEQAYKALDSFIASAAASRHRLVLVITGKGSGAGTIGVLRRNVPHWLRQISNRDLIIGHSEADPRDGGSGALYVRLRKSGHPGIVPPDR